jgi:hypothetical protein
MQRWIFAIALVGALSAAGERSASAQTVLSRSVFGNGGAPTSGVTMACNSTIGQNAIGLSLAPSMRLPRLLVRRLSQVSRSTCPAGPARRGFYLPPNPTRAWPSSGVAAAGEVRHSCDVTGRLVSVAQEGRMEAGRHSISWSGRDADGQALARGVYYARLEVDGQVAGRRSIVLVR